MSQILNTLRIYKKLSLLIFRINHGYINMIEIKILFIDNKNIINIKLRFEIIKYVSQ